MTDSTSELSQPGTSTTLEPNCTVEGLKRHAKLLRSKLGPDKTIKLSHAQTAVVRCIGRSVNNVFSGREPSQPVFPAHVQRSEQQDYQRYREIATLSEMFPHLELAKIIEFVSSWNLVHWREVDPSQAVRGEWSQPEVASPFAGRLHGAALGTTASCVLPEDIDSVRALLASIVTPTPIETFMPPTLDFTCEKANAFAKIAGTSSPSFAYYVTARVFGFGSWAEFEQTFRLGARSQFDEELSSSALTRRRKWQTEALVALLSTHRLAAIELHSFWRPTSTSTNYASAASWKTAGTTAQSPETKNATRISGKLSAKPRTTA